MKSTPSLGHIQLTRIHAINWYGFCDSFDLAGQTVITGVYGCGKTGLIDLIQTVLLGAPEREERYNLSLAEIGSAKRDVKRDLRGYCLQDLNLQENGHAVYGRLSTRTYIALEFTWPGEIRRETWGLRIEYTSVGSDMDLDYWKVPARLEFGNFLGPDEIPLSAEDWEGILALHKETTFASRTSYLEALSATQHLNFNLRVFKPLLLQTLRFNFGRDFTEFCRANILPEDLIDLESVRSSYDRYRRLVEKMKLLEEQRIILERIQVEFQRQARKKEEIVSLGWFRQKSIVTERLAEKDKAVTNWTQIRKANQMWLAKQDELERARDKAELDVRSLVTQVNATPEAIEFDALKKRQHSLPAQITALQNSLADPPAEFRSNFERFQKLWSNAQRSAVTHGWPVAPPPVGLPDSLPSKFDADMLGQHVSMLLAAVDPLTFHFSQLAVRITAELRSAENRVSTLRGEIQLLNARKPVEDLPLHQELTRKLGSSRVRLIGSLCEITDDKWTDALELNFGHKFASFVANTDIVEAFKLYNNLAKIDGREQLVCPRDFHSLPRTVLRGSLAEKITSTDPDVSSLLAHLYGDVHCCDTVEEAETFPRAILPSGAMKQQLGRRRSKLEPTEYMIGDSGRKRMLGQQQRDLNLQQLAVAALMTHASAAKEPADGFQGIKETLLRLSTHKLQQYRALERLQDERDQLHNKLDRFQNRADLEALSKKVAKANTVAAAAAEAIREHATCKPAEEMLAKNEMDRAENAWSEAETARLKWDTKNPLAVEVASRHQELEEEIRRETAPGKSPSAACELLEARRERDVTEAQARVREDRVLLKHDLRFTDYRDIVESNFSDNIFFDKKLRYIVESGTKELHDQGATAEAEWEERFQQQVLGQLSQRLGEIRQIFEGLRRIISGRQIGGATYEFKYASVGRADLDRLRDLATSLETDGLLSPDDPKLTETRAERRAAMESLIAKGSEPSSLARVRELLDARYYFTYDMEIMEAGRTEPVSLARRGRKGSGGETYNPYFIALMTAYLRAYQRHDRRARPSICLLLMDEAFKVLNSEAVRDCVRIIHELELQGVISCTDTNGGQIVEFFQWAMIVQKRITPGAAANGHDLIENTIYAAARNDPGIAKLVSEP